MAVIGGCRCAGDLDLSGPKLCVIKKERSLRSSLLFECDGSTLGRLAGWGELELGDLTAAEKLEDA